MVPPAAAGGRPVVGGGFLCLLTHAVAKFHKIGTTSNLRPKSAALPRQEEVENSRKIKVSANVKFTRTINFMSHSRDSSESFYPTGGVEKFPSMKNISVFQWRKHKKSTSLKLCTILDRVKKKKTFLIT